VCVENNKSRSSFSPRLFQTLFEGQFLFYRYTLIMKKKSITCNNPKKGSNSRAITSISSKLLAMLKSLPQNNDKVFGSSTTNSLKATFTRERRRLAFKLQNSRLLCIHFHTLRY